VDPRRFPGLFLHHSRRAVDPDRGRDWTRHEVTAQVLADAISIIFGVFLNGRGQIELRNPEVDPHPANL
jgi:hypothetical protein